jgi:hypothetical protein
MRTLGHYRKNRIMQTTDVDKFANALNIAAPCGTFQGKAELAFQEIARRRFKLEPAGPDVRIQSAGISVLIRGAGDAYQKFLAKQQGGHQ